MYTDKIYYKNLCENDQSNNLQDLKQKMCKHFEKFSNAFVHEGFINYFL